MHNLPKFTIILLFILYSGCGIYKPVDARKTSVTGTERAKKNIEEGRGFKLLGGQRGGDGFEFASSNELWRASLDILNFMPLTSANYSGGIIITDWYSEAGNSRDSIKITIRFLSNEIRSDAFDIDIFYKNCVSINNCSINKKEGPLKKELTKKILTKAAVYKKQSKDKKKSSPDN